MPTSNTSHLWTAVRLACAGLLVLGLALDGWAAPERAEGSPFPQEYRGVQGPVGGHGHVHEGGEAAAECCGLDAAALAVKAASALAARPGKTHEVVVARVPGLPPHPAIRGEALVRFAPWTSARAIAARHGLTLGRVIPELRAAVLASPGVDPAALVARLAQDPGVTSARPNWALRTALTPQDELFPLALGAQDMRVERAWDLSLGDGVEIALLDTGVDGAHADLAGVLAPSGWTDLVNASPTPMDDNGHGTALAGILAARHDGRGVAGIAPLARLHVVKVADRSGVASAADLAAGIALATQRNVRIICIALGAPVDDATVKQACDRARAAGILVLAAAGNENHDAMLYPAAYDGVLGVGGAGVRPGGVGGLRQGASPPAELAFRTALDPRMALLAPSEKVVAPLPGGVHGYVGGTSAGAAHASGVAALCLARAPGLTRDELERLLRTSVEPIPALAHAGEQFPFGRLDAGLAVERAAAPETDVAVREVELLPREPEEGAAAKVRIVVENRGLTTVPTARVATRWWSAQSPLHREVAAETLRGLLPGERREVTLVWPATRMPAKGDLEVEAELFAVAGERRTGDNKRALASKVVEVPVPGAPVPPATAASEHDVRLARLLAAPTTLGSGGARVEVTFGVRNRGRRAETDVLVEALAGGARFALERIPRLDVGELRTVTLAWPVPAQPKDTVEIAVRVAPRAGEVLVEDNDATAIVRLGASSATAADALYQQGSDVDLISDAPFRIAGGRPYVPLLLFAPSKASTDVDTWVSFSRIEVVAKDSPNPAASGTTVYRGATGAAPSVIAPGLTVHDEMGALTPSGQAFEGQELRKNGRHSILRVPRGVWSLGTLPAERYLDVRMDWRFHRKILWVVTVSRSGSNKKVLRVSFADAPLPALPGDNHYYDTHFHTIAEWFFGSFTQIFAPRKAYGGPLVMAAESAYAIGMIDDPTSVTDLITTSDHNCFFNELVGVPDDPDLRPPYGPSSPAASGGRKEHERYRELFGVSAGEEVCVEAYQLYGAGGVNVAVPMGAHMLAYRGEHIEGPWHGGGIIPDPAALPGARVDLHDTLRTWANTNQAQNANAFAYAAHPFSAGLGWPDSHKELALGLNPANRTLDHVHLSPAGFVMKGLQLWNGRGARSLPSNVIDFEDLNPWVDAAWQAGNSGWDGSVGEGLTAWHRMVADLLGYAFTADPDGVFVRKVFIAGGSDAHGDFNYDISRLATPIPLQTTFSVGSSPYGCVRTYVLGDGGTGATRGERLMEAFSSGRSVATDGALVSFTLDAEGRFDAGSLRWHDQADRAEDDDGRIGGSGAFDGGGTALVVKGAVGAGSAWFRYQHATASDMGSGRVETIHVYRDRPGDPNPTRRQGSVDMPRAAGRLAVPAGSAGTLLAEKVDAAEEGLVTAPTAYSLGAFTGGDPDVAPLGVEERRGYTNPIWALPIDVQVRSAHASPGAYAAGELVVTIDFPVSMDGGAVNVEVKPLDASGDSTDGSVLGHALTGTWSRAGGARNARLTLTNPAPIPVPAVAYPVTGTAAFVVYFRDPPQDLFGNPLNRAAFRFTTAAAPAPGSGGSASSPAVGGAGAGGAGGGGGGGCVIRASAGSGVHPLSALLPWALLMIFVRVTRCVIRPT